MSLYMYTQQCTYRYTIQSINDGFALILHAISVIIPTGSSITVKREVCDGPL